MVRSSELVVVDLLVPVPQRVEVPFVYQYHTVLGVRECTILGVDTGCSLYYLTHVADDSGRTEQDDGLQETARSLG